MTTKEQLIDQHIREYESRLKHIDELYERAHQATEHLDDEHETRSELKDYASQRSRLQQKADEIKTMPIDNWRKETIQNAGPMAIWDVLAQKLEDFIERHGS
ncbi:MAG: hypothetical protein GY935_16100 [Gammaproteobacteria bacterium]|nr:hypothetical protein [Gammaproteobacteria bacterium]